MMAEKSSLEGWTKVVDNAMRKWCNDTENVDASGARKFLPTIKLGFSSRFVIRN